MFLTSIVPPSLPPPPTPTTKSMNVSSSEDQKKNQHWMPRGWEGGGNGESTFVSQVVCTLDGPGWRDSG